MMKKTIAVAALIVSTTGLAQNLASTLQETFDVGSKATTKNWNIGVSATASSNSAEAKEQEDGYRTSTLSLSLNYRLPNNMNARLFVEGKRDFNEISTQEFTRSYLGLSGTLKNFGAYLQTAWQTRAYLPVSITETEEKSYRASAFGQLSATLNLGIVGLNEVSVNVSSSLAKNFHEYTRTRSNTVNTSYYSTSIVAVSYAPVKNGALTFYGANTTKWDYDNVRRGDRYTIGQSIDWAVNNELTAKVGHEIEANTYGHKGNDLNIAFYDKNKSSLYTNISYVY